MATDEKRDDWCQGFKDGISYVLEHLNMYMEARETRRTGERMIPLEEWLPRAVDVSLSDGPVPVYALSPYVETRRKESEAMSGAVSTKAELGQPQFVIIYRKLTGKWKHLKVSFATIAVAQKFAFMELKGNETEIHKVLFDEHRVVVKDFGPVSEG